MPPVSAFRHPPLDIASSGGPALTVREHDESHAVQVALIFDI